MNKIQDFIENVPNSEKSKKTYKGYINTFFNTLKINPINYITNEKTNEKYVKDIITFLNKKKESPPKTLRAIKSTIISFLEYNEIEFTKKQNKRINRKIKGRRAVTIDKTPKKHEIKLMLQYTTDPKMRAIILIGISSGMRIYEILNLKTTYIDFKKNPTTIYIPFQDTKNNESRIVFISNEAKDALQAWLNIRKDYIKQKQSKDFVRKRQKRTYAKNCIFPLTYEAVRTSLIKLLNKSKLNQKDNSTNRYKIHIHTFRKFFKKNMTNKIEENLLNHLIAHDSELDNSYRKPDEEELRQAYLENMQYITIYETPMDYAETENKITNIDDQLDSIQKENQNIKKRLTEQQETFGKLLSLLAHGNPQLVKDIKDITKLTKWYQKNFDKNGYPKQK